jgi:23S rRNA pseudouridine1911/1915/1917 synthase
MEETRTVTADASHDDARLDKVVKDLFDVPWSTARGWIQQGKISVNATVVTELDTAIFCGNEIQFSPAASPPGNATGFDPRCIVHMDNHLVVASKPAGVLTVPFLETDRNTFDVQIRKYLTRKRAKSAKRKGAMASLMVVHRLDKLTSGLLVFPRSVEARDGLVEQFREHSVARQYLALVHGLVKSQTIRTHLMEDRGDGIRGSCESSPHGGVRRSQKGKLAITHVEVIELLKNASLIKCILDTGRTNQIRIQLGEQGHPLIGERTYTRNYKGRKIDSKYLMLHAGVLGFTHPITGESMHFEVEPPATFQQMHQSLKRLQPE